MKNSQNSENLTLKGYWEQLQASPAKFKESVKTACQISDDTFYKWMKGITKPSSKLAWQKLSEITGIPQDQLFK